MAKGLYKSIYDTGELYSALYSRRGASPPTKRTDIRLGNYGLNGYGQVEESFFSKDFGGVPVWLISIFFLGFGYAVNRKKRIEQTA